MDKKFPVPLLLNEISGYFRNANFSAYLVGGVVLDFFLEKSASDWDIATNAQPEKVMHLFRRTIPTGIEHGTVTIRFRGKSIECTTLRREEGYTDARHPDKVVYGSSIIEDLSRRDFTMNAMAASLPDGSLFDPYNGKNDIKSSLVRAVGDPLIRFSEDGLRPMRAIRFAGQLGFEIESETLKAISLSLEKVSKVSIERIQEEFNKILKAKYTSNSLKLLRATGVFSVFLPETSDIVQKDFEILISKISYIPRERFDLRLVILFSYIYTGGKSIEKIKDILKRLKYSNKIIEDVTHLVEFFDFDLASLNTQIKIRYFIKETKKEYIDDVLMLKKAVISSSPTPSFGKIEELEKEIKTILKEGHPLTLKELGITGNDLLVNGFEAGPHLGLILKKLLDVVLEDPSKNTKDELLKIANNFK